MAAVRARRMNVPLRRVAYACGLMFFALLAALNHVQAFRADGLRADPRDPRLRIERLDRPRGDLLTREGRLIATSRRTSGPYSHRRHYPAGRVFAAVTGHVSLNGARGWSWPGRRCSPVRTLGCGRARWSAGAMWTGRRRPARSG
ncbi:hypothetical protein [Thermocatellispora tengchongensis]|uniref:hypothetical protein n=1 Tax=Thermocatellispora tengchongensis TaxID=1073253 RepID=UPI003629832F